MADVKDPGLAIRYEITIDGIDLGSFTKLEGLEGEYEVVEYSEGGNNGYVHRLPGRLRYGNIKLTRPLDRQSGKLAGWFSSLQDAVSRKEASIRVFDGSRAEIAAWDITGVWPVKYTGPELSSDGEAVAKETLELAHHGFKLQGL